MRQITQDAIRAFIQRKPFKRSNTEVKVFNHTGYSDAYLFLHGNMIAKVEGNRATRTKIQTAGYTTRTTKERLNGLPNVHIVQKNFQWYMNGYKWNGEWIDTFVQGEDL
tara:strand:- start:210 stop:536 length:327 start_codon:yes stop_codon:yes gene_type:complete